MRSKVDDRRSRNIVSAALLTLIIIYAVKLSFPQRTLHGTALDHAKIFQETTPRPNHAQLSGSGSTKTLSRKPTATPTPLFSGSYNGTIIDKVAVIVEDRPRHNLVALILHFSAVLGLSWPIIIYTSSENVGIFSSSAALGRYLRSGIISIRILPPTVLFTNSNSVSAFLTKPWLWEDLAPAKHVLLFQSDSILCANAARSVEDFFEYDFVGAPFAPHLGTGMNGGLSLRKRETILRILNEWDWVREKGSRFEDRWYFDRMNDLRARENETGPPEGCDPINLPSIEVARTFSVETIDFPHPLGVHQAHRWLGAQMLSLDDWCPEYKLCSTEFVQDT